MNRQEYPVAVAEAGQTLAALLRKQLPGQSWTAIRRLIDTRRVLLNDELCRDPARRVKAGDTVAVLERAAPQQPAPDGIVLRHVDEHIVVVEKPAGIATVRHPAERQWKEQRRALVPTLDDLVAVRLAHGAGQGGGPPARLRVVQRLDKETSGLLVFARSVLAERALGTQFKAHTVQRVYLALVPGRVASQRIATELVRDRGDGRRGSSALQGVGKQAVTHVRLLERLADYSLLACTLETGRTHQIRIHLAELGHPLCGEQVYNRLPGGEVHVDASGAPRLALHAHELGFLHPESGIAMHWVMELPPDLAGFLDRLRRQPPAAR